MQADSALDSNDGEKKIVNVSIAKNKQVGKTVSPSKLGIINQSININGQLVIFISDL